VKSHTVEVVDSLSLLSLKVASNVFDLSSGLHHISIRDQIVRAQLAVRDLKNGDQRLRSLLIVGAGPAGIAAALEAVEQGVAEVVVVDARSQPFGLLRSVNKRFVGPYMYEWPGSFSRNQSYPEHGMSPWEGRSKSQLEWKAQHPVSAASLANELEQHLQVRFRQIKAAGKAPPTICLNVHKGWIRSFVKSFAQRESARALSRLQGRKTEEPLQFGYWNDLVWPAMEPAHAVSKPQYILLAAGMGAETVTLVKEDMSGAPYTGPNFSGAIFWSDDTLMDAGTQDLRVSVFGGGDGALQDVLRALTRRNHPLELLAFLERDVATKAALLRASPRLLDAERQSRQFGTWTQRNGEYATIDAVCRQLAERLARQPRVARRVSQSVAFGKGEVTLFVRGKCFDKAYLLNRFLVHLIWACRKSHPTMWAGRMGFAVHFEQSAVAYAQSTIGGHRVTIKRSTDKPATGYSHTCDKIAVRYGITPGTVPGAQMIQVSPKPSRQRTTLARVELPFVVERA
jgi:hypothetical protein